MRVRRLLYLLLWMGLGLHPAVLCAQTAMAESAPLDSSVILEIKGRLHQYVEGMDRICASSKAPLPISNEVQLTDGYLKMLRYRHRNLLKSMKSLDMRWTSYYSLEQWEISQDEGLMASVERYELLKQEAGDSLAVRAQMLDALDAFSQAHDYISDLDSTYNRIGKKAFSLSLSSKTAPLLEKEKKKEQLLFSSVQDIFEKAQEAKRLNVVSEKRMAELEDLYAVIKSKSDTIQAMEYKPFLERIKDYLMSLAAVAVLLMFLSMARSKWKAAREKKESLKKYKETMKLYGQDHDYPTI